MAGIQTNNGKAYEYACLKSLEKLLGESQTIVVDDNPQFHTAMNFYQNMSAEMQEDLTLAADAAARVVVRLEPQLRYPQGTLPLHLSLQTDAKGQGGDVRDVICYREDNNWEMGLSCKHNHHAVKHSRLSDKIDFGKEWFDISCSETYFEQVVPLFLELRNMRDESKKAGSPTLWSDIPDKNQRYYVPILTAFMEELRRLAAEHAKLIPERLIQYLIGKNDFYKVITDDNHRTTRVEAVNLSGTLNMPSGDKQSIVAIQKLHLPSRFYHIDFKEGSDTTIEVVCDEGWTISMRIHNASSRVEPSLKFDVNLISLPSSIHAQVEPWEA